MNAAAKIIITLTILLIIAAVAAVMLRVSSSAINTENSPSGQDSLPAGQTVADEPVEVEAPLECNAICGQSCTGFTNPADTRQCLNECQVICSENAATVE